jgi:lipopolysaccharide transport system permease protein
VGSAGVFRLLCDENVPGFETVASNQGNMKSKGNSIREEALQQELLIEPNRPALHYWRDVWRYRELFWFLTWRDILVRYKQTVIGVAWSVIRPLATMLAFTVVFGLLAKLPSEGVPYPLLVFAAMLPWNFCANALSESSGSLIGNANLLTKVYFPRIIIPVSSIIVSLIDFVISLIIMACIMMWYGYLPDWRIVTVPIFLLQAFLPVAGAGLWFSALNVKYRDFRYVVPFLLQFGLYVSPVGFASSIVPEKWRLLYALNPMVGVIDGFRWALLRGAVELNWPGLVISTLLSLALLASGLWFFRKAERILADVI